MSVVLSEQLPLLATAQAGIQKLRGLILELAVRGKLVPQDPNDEPASELLKRIANERARLEAEGKIKKAKAQPPVDEDEQPFGLPETWKWSRLGIVSEKLTDGSHNPPPDCGSGLPMLSSQNVQDGWIDTSNPSRYLSEQDFAAEDSRTKVTIGDVLLTIVASIGRSAVVTDEHCRFALQRSVAVIRSGLAPNFLSIQLRAPVARNYYDKHGKGTAQKGIYLGKLGEMPVAIPPLAEQHRIVAKVDELMSLCDRLEAEHSDATAEHERLVATLLGTLTQSADAANLAANWQRLAEHFDTLFTTESSLDALKQTILQLAVMGKLVAQDPNDEPASELLKRIAKERARLEAEGTCKKSKAMPPVDGDAFYSLPNNWQWSALDSLVRVMDSGWSPACIETPSPNNDVWGVLKTTAVQTFQYLEYENKELPAHLEPRPECVVAAGDILITRAGPKNRVAISCLVETTRPRLMISDKIIRFHLVEGGMYEKFVALCLNAGATAAYLENAKSGMAASQMNITQEKLRAVPIPICSTSEQHRIVVKVDELLALINRLKDGLAESRAQQDRLATTLIETALKAA